MSEEIEKEDFVSEQQAEEEIVEEEDVVEAVATGKFSRLVSAENSVPHKLTGMYKEWFLDYASYVILERAVPHLDDGLKPVQRRILHSLKRMDDGRYNKVANIIGHTMQFHPHGDASIGDALVGLGQKDLLIDCQGNWGNTLTGDSAAAPRYIEARLSKFALDVVFNHKTTEWMSSYDGRNQEPVTLPVKFPLLLSQGVEGIAVGLASKILPHNFCELIDASIKYLQDEPFELYPDFATGGSIDCSRYNDGLRGGAVKVRAKIVKTDRKTLTITELPFGKTTSSLIDSIIKANDKGKIKIRKIDDNTSANVEIIIHLTNDVSPDKTIDALYAFTDCEVSISPNSCVILDKKPLFLGVSQILRISVDNTRKLLCKELEIRLAELGEDWHFSSLEKIFIVNGIYKVMEQCSSLQEVVQRIDNELTPYKSMLKREITREDILKLTEIKLIKTTKYSVFRADEHIRGLESEIEQVERDLNSLTQYTIAYYKDILKKYGKGRERKCEIRSFDTIEATKVVIANAKLYVNSAEGFYGIGAQMRKEEFVSDCSDIDDVILFNKEGKYIISKVSEKGFFSKNILYCGVFKKNDTRTIYNVIYRDGKNGAIYMKRCSITAITRDREYDMTKGTPGSEILYLSVNLNGEAETLKIYFKPRPRLKKNTEELDFSTLAIKGRSSQGNLLTRYAIHKIVMKERGISTLKGLQVWYDSSIRRLNTEGRGDYLGEFEGDDKLLIFTKSNTYLTCGYDISQHFPEDIASIEKWDSAKVFTVIYVDKEQGYHYIKRFTAEQCDQRPQLFVEEGDIFVLMCDDKFPALQIRFGGKYNTRPSETIDAEEFIGVKSHRAKGKRLSNYEVAEVVTLEPLEKELPPIEYQEEVAELPTVHEEVAEPKQMELF
ncbi:Topoisomerase IV subunit A [Mucinivorans hirudinis]|uniref:Topoisomerase IV subunit A n=1 Tax=Mucinivorans hirudinis TaxID=1433126 RepID=A0A060R7G4_9BACT|nr:Topoisomerase IV subunit A [Mucinivorans hirudinis]